MKKLISAIVAVVLILSVSIFAYADENVVVKIAVTSETPELWDAVNNVLAANGKNITVKAINLGGADGSPNDAVAQGEVDLNAFQHYAYFEKYSTEHDIYDQLAVIGETLIVPLSLFSAKHTDVEELKAGGAVIAIPEDTTNQGRALKVLENAGLLTVDESVGLNGVIKNISDNPYDLSFVELPGTQVASALPDVDAAIINCGVAVSYGLDPEKDPIYRDDVDLTSDLFKPFINIIVARADQADNETYLAVVDAYHSPEVAEAIKIVYGGAAIPAFDVP